MKYEIVLCDFPWPYTSFGTAKLPYGTMTEAAISSFPWSDLMAKRCVIFVWVTAPLMFNVQARCIRRWEENHGLVYQGMPYVWVKTKKDGAPMGASGPRPRLVKPVTEFVVALSNVKKGRPFDLLTESQSQTIFAPRRGHSRKPDEVATRIVELLGDRPRIELFARGASLPGWDQHGDEASTPNWTQNVCINE
jgi:N6-adenosine-specific RNA methylase IME4